MPRTTLPFVVLALAATAVAQNRILVPSQVPEIALAIQAATPGTVIEVMERVQPYQPFVIDRPVTIVGRAGEHRAPSVVVSQGVGIAVALPPGTRAVVSRIDVRPATGATHTGGARIFSGAVEFEDCRFRSGTTQSNAIAVVEASDSQVSAAFCRFEGGPGGIALRARRATVSLTKTRCFGGTMPSGDGVDLSDCVLHAADSWFLGGEEFLGGPGGVALRVAGVAETWLHDTRGSGGMGQPGGNGLVNTSTTAVEIGSSAFGSGSAFAGGLTLPGLVPSAAVIGTTVNNLALIGAGWNEPPYRRGTLQPGNPWSFQARVPTGSLVLLTFAFAPNGTARTITRQPALRLTDVDAAVIAVGQAPGYAFLAGTLPNDPSLRGTSLTAQALAGAALPLEASQISTVAVR